MNDAEFQQFDKKLMRKAAFKISAAPGTLADTDDGYQEISLQLLQQKGMEGKSCAFRAYAAKRRAWDRFHRSPAWAYGRYKRPIKVYSYEEMFERHLDLGYDEGYEPDFISEICVSEIWPLIAPDDRIFLRLYYLEELTGAELARAYKVTEGAICQMRDRILDRVRQAIGI